MAKSELWIGTTPAEEECAQTGLTPQWDDLQKLECRAYIEAIKKLYGNPPKGVELKPKRAAHDFGGYYEVAIVFDDQNVDATEWAFQVDERPPLKWEDVGMWAPVVYGKSAQFIQSIVDDIALCDKATNPQQITIIEHWKATRPSAT